MAIAKNDKSPYLWPPGPAGSRQQQRGGVWLGRVGASDVGGAGGVGFRAGVGLSGRVFIPNTLNCQEVGPPPAGGTVHQNERKVTLCWPGWGRAGEDTPPLISIRWCETSRGGVGTYNRRDGAFPLESCWGWYHFLANMRWNLLGVCLGKKSRWFPLLRLGFRGTQGAGFFLSRSSKSGEKVCVDLPWFTQNVFMEHLLYASTGSHFTRRWKG